MWRCAGAIRRARKSRSRSPTAHAGPACGAGAVEAQGDHRAFSQEAEPYRALVSPMWKTRYGDYDHLARVKEWSAGGEDEDGVE